MRLAPGNGLKEITGVRLERMRRHADRVLRGGWSLQQIPLKIGVLSGWCVECTARANVAGFADLRVAIRSAKRPRRGVDFAAEAASGSPRPWKGRATVFG